MASGRFSLRGLLSKRDAVKVPEPVTEPSAGDVHDETSLDGLQLIMDTLGTQETARLIEMLPTLEQVPEFVNALDKISEAVVVGLDDTATGFRIEVDSSTPQSYRRAASRIVDDVMSAPGLFDSTSLIRHVRTLVEFGNVFVQPVYRTEIVRAVQMPVLEIQRLENASGLLEDPAYKQIQGGAEVGRFKHWQIAHVRAHIPNGRKYGRSHTLAAAALYSRLAFVSSVLLTERVKSSDLTVHYIDVTDCQRDRTKVARRVGGYKLRHAELRSFAQDKVFGGVPPSDLYVPRALVTGDMGELREDLNRVERLTGRTSFQDQHILQQYYYHRFVAALKVPPPMLGLSVDMFPQGFVEVMMTEFERVVRAYQAFMSMLPMQILHNEATIRGLDSRKIAWTLLWPNPSRSDARMDAYIKYTLMRADQMAVEKGVIDPRWVAMNRYGLTSDEYTEMIARQRSQMLGVATGEEE